MSPAVKPTAMAVPRSIHRCGSEASSSSSSSSSSVSDSFEDLSAPKVYDGSNHGIAPAWIKSNVALLPLSSTQPPPTKPTISAGPQPILLQILPHPTDAAPVDLGVEINLALPVISYVHPTSPLLRHLHAGDVLLELDGTRSTELDYRQLHRWFRGRSPTTSTSARTRTLLFLPGKNSPHNPLNATAKATATRADASSAGRPYLDVVPLAKRPSSSSSSPREDSNRQVFSRRGSDEQDDDDGGGGTMRDAGPEKVRSDDAESSFDGGAIHGGDDGDDDDDDEEEGSSANTPRRRIRPRGKDDVITDNDNDSVEKEAEEPVSPSTAATTLSKSSDEGSCVVVSEVERDDEGGGNAFHDRARREDARGMELPMTPDLDSSSHGPSNGSSYRSVPNSMLGGADCCEEEGESKRRCQADGMDCGQNDVVHDEHSATDNALMASVSLDSDSHEETIDRCETASAMPLINNPLENSIPDNQGDGPDENEHRHPKDDVSIGKLEPSIQNPAQTYEHSKHDSQGMVPGIQDVPVVVSHIESALESNLINNISNEAKKQNPQQQQIVPNPTTSDCIEDDNWEKILLQQRNRPSPNVSVIHVKLGLSGDCEEDISTIYGGKYNPSLHAATTKARIEDLLIGYMEKGQYHDNQLPLYDCNTLSQLTLGRGRAGLSEEQIDRESRARRLQLEERDYLMKKARLDRIKRGHHLIEGVFALLILLAVGVLIGILLVSLRGKSH